MHWETDSMQLIDLLVLCLLLLSSGGVTKFDKRCYVNVW